MVVQGKNVRARGDSTADGRWLVVIGSLEPVPNVYRYSF